MKKQKPQASRSQRWERDSGPAARPQNQWYIAGLNGVRECLRSPHIKVTRIWASKSKVTPELWKDLGPFAKITEELQGRDTSFGPATQGIAALVKPPRWPDIDDLLDAVFEEGNQPLFLMLDQVEDPMNLGQILRTCEGVGVHGVLLPKHRTVHMTETVAQISQGAFAWMPVLEVGNLRNTLQHLKDRGVWIAGSEAGPGSKPWNQCDFTGATTLVMGAEGKGLRDLTRKTCDYLVSLPMNGRISSLNVGAATSAFLYEIARQRIQAD